VSVPSSELGPLTPSAASECVSPLGPKGGGEQHSLAGEGGGVAQFRRRDRKPGTLYTLWVGGTGCSYPSLPLGSAKAGIESI
jgi:hypothetical protein